MGKNTPLSREEKWFYILLLGIGIVYFSHLGLVPVHATADECRRALVPLEMYITGDYLSPTLNGEIYLNKPPLYNWIVALSYHVFGSPSTFALRFPVVLSILIHGVIIFLIVKKFTDPMVAGMTALAFMTNGRTLIHDSMLGLLEHTLALFIYCGLMLIFILGEKKKYGWLFVLTYFIAAIGFLIKGLPALAHHGMGLLVYFIYSKKLKLLFSFYHVLGVIVFIATLASYYIPFLFVNDLNAGDVFFELLTQSSKRYEVSGASDFLNVLIDFPLDFIKHFLPWTLLLILLVRKKIHSLIGENRFVAFNALLFVSNIPFYWIAALKNPHYLYFILPLLFTVIFYAWHKTDQADWRRSSIEILFLIGIGIAFVFSVYLPFNHYIMHVPGIGIKSAFLAFSFLILLILYKKYNSYRVYVFAAALIVIRLGFNWMVIPQRIGDQMIIERHASAVHQIVKEAPLYIMAEYPAGYYDGITYNLERIRNEILKINMQVDTNSFYLVDDQMLEKYPHIIYYKFPYIFADNHENFKREFYLVKFGEK